MVVMHHIEHHCDICNKKFPTIESAEHASAIEYALARWLSTYGFPGSEFIGEEEAETFIRLYKEGYGQSD